MNLRKIVMVVVLIMMGVFSFRVSALAQFCAGNGADSSNPQIDTAIGCIPVKMDQAIAWFLPYLFGIAGGISFILMVSGFIQITLSGGDPKTVAGAQETITSAITGLIISIFSLFILRLIVVGILKIPGIS